MSQWQKLWRDEEGQDLTEYALLLAFIALTTAALITVPASSVSQIWLTENSEMSTAASAAVS
jgi:Flp pilus assembly pilin Flp